MMTRAKVANEVDGIQVYRVLEGSGGGAPHPTPPHPQETRLKIGTAAPTPKFWEIMQKK
jgi:hypothetical protein